MPVVLRKKGFQFLFYASDGDEPQHIHVRKGRKTAKYWLTPVVSLEKARGFRRHELNEADKIINENLEYLLESWDAFFGN